MNNICDICNTNNKYIFINDHVSCFKEFFLSEEKENIESKYIFNNIYLAIKNNSFNIYEYLVNNYYNIKNIEEYTLENYLDILSNIIIKDTKYLVLILEIIYKYRYDTLILILNDISILNYDNFTNNVKYILENIDYTELNYNIQEKKVNNTYSNKYYLEIKNEIIQTNIIELIDFYFRKICIFKSKYFNYVNNYDTYMCLINNNYKINIHETYMEDMIVSVNNAKDIRIINYLLNNLQVKKTIIDKMLLEFMKHIHTTDNIYFKKIYTYFLSRYDNTIYEILNIDTWTIENYEKYKLFVEDCKDEELLTFLKNYFLKSYEINHSFKYAFKLLENKYIVNLVEVNKFTNNKYLTLLNIILEKDKGYITFNRKMQDIIRHDYTINNIPAIKLLNKFYNLDKLNYNTNKQAIIMLEEKEKLNNVLQDYNIYDRCTDLINSLFII